MDWVGLGHRVDGLDPRPTLPHHQVLCRNYWMDTRCNELNIICNTKKIVCIIFSSKCNNIVAEEFLQFVLDGQRPTFVDIF